ncbi:hypothetical protein H4R18_004909 [Coemansia javaensis]|uniref:Thioesterase domain-containing protein n=1 Tax=Coemansia javaensis TaxID=2761396 RepID=A0A9W8LF43_9FUNG|nr:hypothetical protein H4R18_004909 [Coemansia javaensis]
MAGSGAVLAHVRQVLAAARARQGFDMLCFDRLNIVSAEAGRVRAEIEVGREHLNLMGGTHGGWLSTMVDVGGSLAIATHGLATTGVSTDLSVSFLAPSGEGATLLFDARVLKLGRTLAYTRVDIFSGERMVATGSHTKYVAGAQPSAAARDRAIAQ